MIQQANDPAARKPLEDRVTHGVGGRRGGRRPEGRLARVRADVRRRTSTSAARPSSCSPRSNCATNNEDDARRGAVATCEGAGDGRRQEASPAGPSRPLARLMTTPRHDGRRRRPVRASSANEFADTCRPRRQDRGRLPQRPAHRQAAAAVPGADPRADAGAGEGEAEAGQPRQRRQRRQRRAGRGRGQPVLPAAPPHAGAEQHRRRHLGAAGRRTARPARTGASSPACRMYAPNSVPHHRVAQAHGQLLLVHTGHMVHCFDLAEKKELWTFNLLGDTKLDQNRNYNDGTLPERDGRGHPARRRTARSSASAGPPCWRRTWPACCPQGRPDRLRPAHRRPLWTRNNVSPTSVLFGDGQHVFVVEKGADNKAARSRVLPHHRRQAGRRPRRLRLARHRRRLHAGSSAATSC